MSSEKARRRPSLNSGLEDTFSSRNWRAVWAASGVFSVSVMDLNAESYSSAVIVFWYGFLGFFSVVRAGTTTSQSESKDSHCRSVKTGSS